MNARIFFFIVQLQSFVSADISYKWTSSNCVRVQREKDDFTVIRGGETYDQHSSRSDFSIGKDRELFHASVGHIMLFFSSLI